MKLSYKEIEPFIKSPNPAARAILIYGPDDGLMRTRTKILAKHQVEDLNDPFNVSILDGKALEEESGRLNDEANAISMMGGDRLVLIENASEKNTKAIKDYLENPSSSTLVLVQGGDLGKNSSLRGLFEKAPNAAAVPCYVQEGYALTGQIRDLLKQSNIQIDNDALQYLSDNLTGDYGQMMSEIDKLVTYMGESKQVHLEDAMNNTGSLSEQKLDDLVYACAGGNAQRSEALLNGLVGEGVSPVYMLRALQGHFRKLLVVQLLLERGESMDTAMRALRPPLFFKLENAFKAQLSKWPSAKLLKVLTKINHLEADLKKTETADALLLTRSIFGLSQMAR